MEHINCWNCGNPSAESLFCRYCNTLQRPESDYFSFFGLPLRLSLDVKDLQERFYRLSRILHPDRYTRASNRERQYSLEATAILNDGYRTLRDPVRRAEYVLRQYGFEAGPERSKNVPPDLLEEVFELNMALEELRGGDASVRSRLEDSRQQFTAMRDEADAKLEELFREFDACSGEVERREALSRIRTVLDRRKYVENLLRDVERELLPAG